MNQMRYELPHSGISRKTKLGHWHLEPKVTKRHHIRLVPPCAEPSHIDLQRNRILVQFASTERAVIIASSLMAEGSSAMFSFFQPAGSCDADDSVAGERKY